MPATGPHTFTDEDGEHWEIVGPYEHAPGYVSIHSLDNPGRVSLRPVGVLGPAGLSVPPLRTYGCPDCGAAPGEEEHGLGCPQGPSPMAGETMRMVAPSDPPARVMEITVYGEPEPNPAPLYPRLAAIEATLEAGYTIDGLGRTIPLDRPPKG